MTSNHFQRPPTTLMATRTAPLKEAGAAMGRPLPHSPHRRRLRAADLQEVVALLQLEVGEDQRDGVPGLGQHGPRAVGVVLVLGREVGAGDAAAGAPEGPPAGSLGCRDRGGESRSGGAGAQERLQCHGKGQGLGRIASPRIHPPQRGSRRLRPGLPPATVTGRWTAVPRMLSGPEGPR